MALKTFVKISKIDNLSDARYCAGMMVDILGFNLEEGSEGFVTAEKFKEITDWVAGVHLCGEFAQAQAAEIKLAVLNYAIQYVEVQNIDVLEELSACGKELILKVIVKSTEDVQSLPAKISFASDFVKYVIISCSDDALTAAISEELDKLRPEIPLLCGYAIHEDSAQTVAENALFSGIELEGSPEDRPGFKDYGAVMDILEVLEED